MKISGGIIPWLLGSVVASWFVVGTALWVLSGPTSREAIAASAAATALLAFGVWWLSGRVPLPPVPTPAFLGLHAFAALMFGSAMIFVTYSVQAAVSGISLGDAARSSTFLGAEFVFWIWLYSVLVTGSYGSRYRSALSAERQLLARAETRAAEARLETLRGQLNPHFLFNALQGVAALVRLDSERAESALERLGTLLRFSLDEASDTTVSLGSELQFTETYVELERLGLGDRLNVRFDVDNSVMDAAIPPFALQVLVENAIRHGVAPRTQGGEVTISIRANNEEIELMVVDNGEKGPDPKQATSGRGLANLRDRLLAYYGNSARLETGPNPLGGFKARLTVPRS